MGKREGNKTRYSEDLDVLKVGISVKGLQKHQYRIEDELVLFL